jgi:hypothetical protein
MDGKFYHFMRLDKQMCDWHNKQCDSLYVTNDISLSLPRTRLSRRSLACYARSAIHAGDGDRMMPDGRYLYTVGP